MKKKNPTDTTLRNVRAANTRLDKCEARLKKIELVLIDVWRMGARVKNLEQRMDTLTKGLR